MTVRILWDRSLDRQRFNQMDTIVSNPVLVRQFETYITGDEDRCVVTGLAVDDAGNMYVADACNKRIKVYDSKGNFRLFFADTGPHKVKEPHDIVVITHDRLAVTDGGDRSVKIYNLKGKFLSSIGKFLDPHGIATNCRNEIIVVDGIARSVYVYSSEGALVTAIRSMNSETLSQPKYITTTIADDIAVTDTQDHSIKIFDRMGQFRYSYQQKTSESFLFHPTGICTDPEGHLVVADEDHHRLLRIRRDNSQESLLANGLAYPRAVCFPDKETLVVAEYYGAIKVYKV